MLIVYPVRALIAVLGLAAVLHQVSCQDQFNNKTVHELRTRRAAKKNIPIDEGWYDVLYNQTIPLSNPGKHLSPRENQQLLRQESKNRTASDCCPSTLEMIEPEGGKNQDDQFVELFRGEDIRQRFYELSCHDDIKDKPCRFMDKKVHEQSRCMQRYSYTYALVKVINGRQNNKNFPTFPSNGPGGEKWALDYIRVRSGCSCVVSPHPKQKRNRQKHKRMRHEDER